MEVADVATHAASGMGGVAFMGYVARLLVVRHLKRRDEKDDKTAEALNDVAVELAKIDVRLQTLQKSVDATAKHGEAIAVLQSQMTDVKRDVNNIGCKVRGLQNGADT